MEGVGGGAGAAGAEGCAGRSGGPQRPSVESEGFDGNGSEGAAGCEGGRREAVVRLEALQSGVEVVECMEWVGRGCKMVVGSGVLGVMAKAMAMMQKDKTGSLFLLCLLLSKE
jgi:hypothetical protein